MLLYGIFFDPGLIIVQGSLSYKTKRGEQIRKSVLRTGRSERKDKFRADAFRTDNINVFMMGMNNFFYNGEAQAGTLFISAPGKIRLVETFPDFTEAVSGNADAGILDGDKGLSVVSITIEELGLLNFTALSIRL